VTMQLSIEWAGHRAMCIGGGSWVHVTAVPGEPEAVDMALARLCSAGMVQRQGDEYQVTTAGRQARVCDVADALRPHTEVGRLRARLRSRGLTRAHLAQQVVEAKDRERASRRAVTTAMSALEEFDAHTVRTS